jgi:hypothetical protein
MKEDMDRLLKTTLRGSTPPPGDACVDPEQLAAWSEGVLSETEAAHVEEHLSNCARCQAVMATLVRSESAASAAPEVVAPSVRASVAPVAVMPARVRRWSPAWLIPLAAAAALVVWFSLPTRPSIETSAPAVARVEPPAAPPVEQPIQSAPSATSSARVAPAQPAAPAPRGAVQPAQRGAARPAPPARGAESRSEPATKAAADSRAAEAAVPAAGAPAPAAAPVAAPAPRATADALSARTAPAITVSGESPIAPVEIVSANNAVQQPGLGRVGAGRGGGAVVGALATPAPAMRWRIVQPNRVERSANGGTSWDAASINPADPPVILTGGASPSASVCWLIGRGGVVLLTTDGLRFDRVSVPDAVDLSAIRAIDARQATVTATDGRTFSTTDAGQTWR